MRNTGNKAPLFDHLETDRVQVTKAPLPDGGYAFSGTAVEVRQFLHRILTSADFDATKTQRAMLEFIVSETLAGRSRGIKGYTVATKVFGRSEDFDQAIDPIVSIQSNKLRRSLERYYLLSGRDDAIRIDIPKGTYVPVFIEKNQRPPTLVPGESIHPKPGVDRHWPTVAIKPFQNLTNDSLKDSLGVGIASELAAEISRFQWINVLHYGPDGQGKRNSDIGARFIVEGSIRQDEKSLKLVVNLVDVKTSRQVWSEVQRFDADLGKIIAFQEKVATTVGAKVAGEKGVITRSLIIESKNAKPDQLTTHEALLRYHQYDLTLSPEDFLTAFQALEKAKEDDPECGQVWSFLARLHANIYSLEIPGFNINDSKQKTLQYAETGARINPDNQGAIGMLALARMFDNDISAARRDINRAHALNPDSLYLMDGIGYVKTLLGDWEQGPPLIRKAIGLNPFYNPVVHYALWIDHLRQDDYQNAYLEIANLRRPSIFWYSLAKASTLGLLDRIGEGRKFAKDLMELKPDFQERGRLLIGHYIKFNNIAGRVIKGLEKVGIQVD